MPHVACAYGDRRPGTKLLRCFAINLAQFVFSVLLQKFGKPYSVELLSARQGFEKTSCSSHLSVPFANVMPLVCFGSLIYHLCESGSPRYIQLWYIVSTSSTRANFCSSETKGTNCCRCRSAENTDRTARVRYFWVTQCHCSNKLQRCKIRTSSFASLQARP